MQHISRRFGALAANDDVTLSVRPGEIHALVGENGAGKTTLMKILYGMEMPDAGNILIHGQHVSIGSPSAAIALGIGMVHQHFMLVPPMSVAENVALGTEPLRWGFLLDHAKAVEETRALGRQFGLAVEPEALVADLSVGLQQRVEILKLLYRRADILILDEPTAVLAPQEIEALFHTLRRLRQQGKTVLLITHRLGEVMEISDRVTVMRRGHVEGEVETAQTSRLELARMMVGKEWEGGSRRRQPPAADIVVDVRQVTALSDRKVASLQDVSFTIARGEILGIAAVEGNGQRELVEVLTGRRRCSRGTVEIEGRPLRGLPAGVSHIPEDRIQDGMVSEFTLAENLVLGRLNEREFSTRGLMNRRSVEQEATAAIRRFDIRPPAPDLALGRFSGGNQQKAVIARELARRSPLLIASHPTRGLDIGATDFVHRALEEERDRGRAILLLSADLAELLELSDRIAVLFKGEIAAIFHAAETDETELGTYMTGARGRSGS